MSPERDIKAVVSGSFSKFKPEIDRKIEELEDHGVTVLAPDKGWVYIPKPYLLKLDDKFRPLPSETEMSPKQIEDEYLHVLSKSDFVYLVNPHGYVGNTASMEIGVAIALGIPVYSQEEVDADLDPSPLWQELAQTIETLSIEEIKAQIHTFGEPSSFPVPPQDNQTPPEPGP